MICGYPIVGDSITYGYGTDNMEKTFAHLIGAMTGGSYVVSPRGGGIAKGVIEKITTECAIVKPKYVMVTIGTNAVSSISSLATLIVKIIEIGALPIINSIPCMSGGGQTLANNAIQSMGFPGCRFDLATAIDPTATTLTPDPSLYADGGTHPNETGFQRMADRVRIDLPFLF